MSPSAGQNAQRIYLQLVAYLRIDLFGPKTYTILTTFEAQQRPPQRPPQRPCQRSPQGPPQRYPSKTLSEISPWTPSKTLSEISPGTPSKTLSEISPGTPSKIHPRIANVNNDWFKSNYRLYTTPCQIGFAP